jgi:DNA repair protein RadA/Sms
MAIKFTKNTAITVPNSFFKRIKTGLKIVDDLFGGGLVGGQVLTVCGHRGAGKTQFMLQLLDACGSKNKSVGYLSCEETIEQIAYTANRIGVDVPISTFNTIDEVLSAMDDLDVLVMDSLSMINIGNKRRLTYEEKAVDLIYEKAKLTNCAIFIVIHMTKNGTMKGSSYLAHKVDANLHIELFPEEEKKGMRKIYTTKNRFGSSKEICLEMTKKGYNFDVEEDFSDTQEIENEEQIINNLFLVPNSKRNSVNKRKTKPTLIKIFDNIKYGMKIIDDFLSK